MPQQEIEVLLARQLAIYLAVPIYIVDPQGTLLFYNEPVERILGLQFEAAGEMSAADWTILFTPKGEHDARLAPEALPYMIALAEQRLAHDKFWIEGRDQVRRCLEVTAFPLLGQARRNLGAVVLFWEVCE